MDKPFIYCYADMKIINKAILSPAHTIFTFCISMVIIAAIVLQGQYFVTTTLKPLVIILNIDLLIILVFKSIKAFRTKTDN